MMEFLGDGITLPAVYSGGIQASGAAFPVIGLILLVLRAVAHRLTKTKNGLADLFAWISWLFILAMGIVFLDSANQGAFGWPTPKSGPPITETTITSFEVNVLTAEYLFLIFLPLALGTTKLSILFFFRQIFAVNHRRFWDVLTRGLIVLVSLWTIAFFLANLLNCGSHPSANWKPFNVFNKYCLAYQSSALTLANAFGASDLILDVPCLLLPFPILYRSNLSRKYKISITAVFLLGIAALAMSIARTVVWFQIDDASLNVPLDANLAIALACYWGMIEAGFAFIAAQLPALGVYVAKFTNERNSHLMYSGRALISLQAMPSQSRNEADAAHDVERHGDPGKEDANSTTTDD